MHPAGYIGSVYLQRPLLQLGFSFTSRTTSESDLVVLLASSIYPHQPSGLINVRVSAKLVAPTTPDKNARRWSGTCGGTLSDFIVVPYRRKDPNTHERNVQAAPLGSFGSPGSMGERVTEREFPTAGGGRRGGSPYTDSLRPNLVEESYKHSYGFIVGNTAKGAR